LGYFDTIHAAGLRLHTLVESLLAIADKAWNEHISGTHELFEEIELAPFAMAIGSAMNTIACEWFVGNGSVGGRAHHGQHAIKHHSINLLPAVTIETWRGLHTFHETTVEV